jgi:hypothetical protein
MRGILYFTLGVAIPCWIAAARNLPRDAGDNARIAAEAAWTAARRVTPDYRNYTSCGASIGRRAARALVRYCIYQSTASHPPCNSGNSCTMIIEEIRRNIRYDRDSVTLPGARDMTRAHWRRVAQLRAI